MAAWTVSWWTRPPAAVSVGRTMPKTSMAGHSTPRLTARYAHAENGELRVAVEAATRQNGPDSLLGVCSGFTQTGDFEGQNSATTDSELSIGDNMLSVHLALENQAFGNELQDVTTASRNGASGIRTQNQGIMSPLL